MKANELMIGDYVTFSDCVKDYTVFPIKVMELHGYNNDFLGQICNEESFDELEFDDEIVPIPLGVVVFSKLGFDHPDILRFTQQFGDIRMELLRVEPFQNIYKFKDYYNWEIRVDDARLPFRISSLHELQHLFRFLGIEKEIEI